MRPSSRSLAVAAFAVALGARAASAQFVAEQRAGVAFAAARGASAPPSSQLAPTTSSSGCGLAPRATALVLLPALGVTTGAALGWSLFFATVGIMSWDHRPENRRLQRSFTRTGAAAGLAAGAAAGVYLAVHPDSCTPRR